MFYEIEDGGKNVSRYIKPVGLILCVLLVLQCCVISACARVNKNENGAFHVAYEDAVEAPGAKAVEETQGAENADQGDSVQETQEVVEEAVSFDEVPLYYQTDYPETMYGEGTVSSNGSGITALAMVASYMTEYAYSPDTLAGYFGGYNGSDMARLEHASDELQLPWEKAENWHYALKAIQEGKVVIALMNSNSIFTEAQHFIVLAGQTVDGTILVNDPYEPNYSNWRLKDGFANGFKESDLCWGFSGGWIYDKNAMPADPFVYVEEEKEEVECRYPDLELTKDEITLLAKLVWLEARGESDKGQQAVAEVVLNRLAADNFPDTLKGIIYAEGQFPSIIDMDKAEPNQTQYEAVAAAMYGPYILPKEVVFYATYKVNSNVWGEIDGHYFCYQWDWKEE